MNRSQMNLEPDMDTGSCFLKELMAINKRQQPGLLLHLQCLIPFQDVEKALLGLKRSYDLFYLKCLEKHGFPINGVQERMDGFWRKVVKDKTSLGKMWMISPHLVFEYELLNFWKKYQELAYKYAERMEGMPDSK